MICDIFQVFSKSEARPQNEYLRRAVFVLVKKHAPSQTNVLMKNFPGAVKISAAVILGIATLYIIQACAHPFVPPNEIKRRFGFIIPKHEQAKHPGSFCKNIKAGLSSNAIYSFEVVLDENGKPESCCNPSDCSLPKLSVKVDKITTFRVAEAPVSGLTPIGSHVTQRIYSNNTADIAVVLGELKAQP